MTRVRIRIGTAAEYNFWEYYFKYYPTHIYAWDETCFNILAFINFCFLWEWERVRKY